MSSAPAPAIIPPKAAPAPGAAPAAAPALAPPAQLAPAPAPGGAAQATVVQRANFQVARGKRVGAQRVLLTGPGGAGKTTLAGLIPNVAFGDVEGGTEWMDVARLGEPDERGIPRIRTFAHLRGLIQGFDFASNKLSTFALDTGSKVEEMITRHVLETIPHEDGGLVNVLEGYGWGKGYRHVYDMWALLLADLDDLVERRQVDVVLICHDTTREVKNPAGENFLRYEPRLQGAEKFNVRERVHGWADHSLYLGFDLGVDKEGKARGTGSRTVWVSPRPTHLVKSRAIQSDVPWPNAKDASIWKTILPGRFS